MASRSKLSIADTPYICEWDYEANGGSDPRAISSKSKEKAFWICRDCHGHYSTYIYLKTRGTKCPYCIGHRALRGFNDLATKYPDLCEEWDYANNEVSPSEVTFGTSKTVNWICKKCGGSYPMRVCERTDGHGCPFCRGIKVLKGYNDLATKRPDVAVYWDCEKNDVGPDEVTASTHSKYHWKCPECGYEWEDSVNRQVSKKGCASCRRGWKDKNKATGAKITKAIKIVTPENCLAKTDPDIVIDWDFEKNIVKPDAVTRGSGKKVYWHCQKCKQRYAKKICEQVKYGCSYCRGRRVISGLNDLATLYPNLALEWNYEKNGELRPDKITAMNTRKVWWRCLVCGKEWQAYVENRTRDNNGCPSCRSRTHTSFPEQALYFYVKKCFKDALNGYREIFSTRMELDIYIPSRKIAVEYDGLAWHKNSADVSRDIKKYDICKRNGILLIRITEGNDKVKYCDHIIKSRYKTSLYNELDEAIKELLHYLNVDAEIDSRRDEMAILEQYLGLLEKESVQEKYPEVCRFWDYSNNGDLKPNMFKATSNVIVSWTCRHCGDSYKRAIKEQVHGLGLCKVCTRKETSRRLHETKLKANGSLQEKCPYVASQWNHDKNGDLRPSMVASRSSQRVWWTCPNKKCQHEWKTAISNRTGGTMSGCPKCHSGRLKYHLGEQ